MWQNRIEADHRTGEPRVESSRVAVGCWDRNKQRVPSRMMMMIEADKHRRKEGQATFDGCSGACMYSFAVGTVA